MSNHTTRADLDVHTLTAELIRRPSVTPLDEGCQTLIAARLQPLGFVAEDVSVGKVTNTWLRRGHAEPLFVFAGHTDVVPPGPLAAWTSPPFQAALRDGKLYGRGAADMKGALAAMVIACERVLKNHPGLPGSIAFLLTSDEEGPALDGTQKVIETLAARHTALTYCLVGEPTAVNQIGDTLKIGRRGSLHANLRILGKQGHIAYPALADNPIHKAFAALQALTEIIWDAGNEHFTPTQCQISNLHAGDGTINVIPRHMDVKINFRFSPTSTADTLQKRLEKVLKDHDLSYEIEWILSAKPFLTQPGRLVQAAEQAIQTTTGQTTTLSTSGGTSDARFIAPTGCEVIELGVVNASIHQIDEHVRLTDLDTLMQLYEKILTQLLLS